MNKLWVDDLRDSPDSTWDIARTFNVAIVLIDTCNYDIISLDHDLGDIHDKREYTGYDVLMYLVEQILFNGMVKPTIYAHTANIVARERMLGVIARYLKD